MAEITIVNAGEWEVWIQLVTGDPTEMGESFIIGWGETKVAAITEAVKDLEQTIATLRGLA